MASTPQRRLPSAPTSLELLHLLKAAAESEDTINELMSGLIEELRISMFCCGVRNLAGLRQVEIVEQLPTASQFRSEFTSTGETIAGKSVVSRTNSVVKVVAGE